MRIVNILLCSLLVSSNVSFASGDAKPASEKSIPVKPAPDQPAPEKPATEKPASDKQAPEKSPLAKSAPAKIAPEKPTYRRPIYESPRPSRRIAPPPTLPVTMPELVKHDFHWGYEGEGAPANWGKMNSTWAECSNGSRQSPIDIRDGIKLDLEALTFDYKLTRFNVIDNGHTIQVDLGPRNYMTVMGKKYELMQFHFHRPSEERIDGRRFEMVAHLVHKNMEGKLAVVALLIDMGNQNNVIQTVWNNIPLEKNQTVSAPTPIDMIQLLPQKREYFTYMGSLTTPPCSEGVLWIVMKEPIYLSENQIGIFARFYPMNARPTQMQNGRVIKESN